MQRTYPEPLPRVTKVPAAAAIPAGTRSLALVYQQLQAAPYRQLSSISCDWHEGVLTLRGVVSTYYLKQLAQVIVRKVDGVEEIANHIEVKYQTPYCAANCH